MFDIIVRSARSGLSSRSCASEEATDSSSGARVATAAGAQGASCDRAGAVSVSRSQHVCVPCCLCSGCKYGVLRCFSLYVCICAVFVLRVVHRMSHAMAHSKARVFICSMVALPGSSSGAVSVPESYCVDPSGHHSSQYNIYIGRRALYLPGYSVSRHASLLRLYPFSFANGNIIKDCGRFF